METKALGQLHFKYYTGEENYKECTTRQVPGSSLMLWKEMYFTWYQAIRISDCGVVVH